MKSFNEYDKSPISNEWIGDDKIEWLLVDESETDAQYQNGKANFENYNLRVEEHNLAKSNEISVTGENTILIKNIDLEIEKLNTSINDLKFEQATLRKRLSELNIIIPRDVQTLNSIKEWLLKKAELIAEKIALLKHKETAEKLRNLHTKITDILNEIDKPLEKILKEIDRPLEKSDISILKEPSSSLPVAPNVSN